MQASHLQARRMENHHQDQEPEVKNQEAQAQEEEKSFKDEILNLAIDFVLQGHYPEDLRSEEVC